LAGFFGGAAFPHHGGIVGFVYFFFGGGLGFGANIFLDGVEFGEEACELLVFVGRHVGGIGVYCLVRHVAIDCILYCIVCACVFVGTR